MQQHPEEGRGGSVQSCALRLGAAHPQAGTCVLGGKLVLPFPDKPVLLLLSLPKNGVFFFFGDVREQLEAGITFTGLQKLRNPWRRRRRMTAGQSSCT